MISITDFTKVWLKLAISVLINLFYYTADPTQGKRLYIISDGDSSVSNKFFNDITQTIFKLWKSAER